MKYVIVEWAGKDPREVFHVTLPAVYIDGSYQQRKSMEGYRRRARKRMPVLGKPAPARWFQIYMERDLEGGLGQAEREAYGYDDLPQHNFSNVFAFYEAIRYDHRRDRYV